MLLYKVVCTKCLRCVDGGVWSHHVIQYQSGEDTKTDNIVGSHLPVITTPPLLSAATNHRGSWCCPALRSRPLYASVCNAHARCTAVSQTNYKMSCVDYYYTVVSSAL